MFMKHFFKWKRIQLPEPWMTNLTFVWLIVFTKSRQHQVEITPIHAYVLKAQNGVNVCNFWDRSGGRLNINMSSYQYRDPHATVLYLTWDSPFLGKTIFILRRGPGRHHISSHVKCLPAAALEYIQVRWISIILMVISSITSSRC